jgi:hypothetical protein
MLAAEGQVHRRMRRAGTPAFSVQNMRAFVPLTFRKARELKDKWLEIIYNSEGTDDEPKTKSCKIDTCHWISRATFDVIGLAGKLLISLLFHSLPHF